MSAWSGKYVIGLTGNIATGKSAVRKMLEHLGAFGIDADAMAHRTIASGAPGFQPVLEAFGEEILDPSGEIERSKLAQVVFHDKAALAQLELIIHPLVREAIDALINRSEHKVVVLEAIKLIESGLTKKCDCLWVSTAPQKLQLARLIKNRGLSEMNATQRIESQHPQSDKIAAADIVIYNDDSLENTWSQVRKAWLGLFEKPRNKKPSPEVYQMGNIKVLQYLPDQCAEISGLISQLSGGEVNPTPQDIMAAFTEKTFLVMKFGDNPAGVAGWNDKNLVAISDEVHLGGDFPIPNSLYEFVRAIDSISERHQCEISLLYLTDKLAHHSAGLTHLGYKVQNPEDLEIQAWREIAISFHSQDTVMFSKQLQQTSEV
jgi:dephospho-CoA kinase